MSGIVLPPGLAESIAQAEAEEAQRREMAAAMVEDVLRFLRPGLAGTRVVLCPTHVTLPDGRVIRGRDRILAFAFLLGMKSALAASRAAETASDPVPTSKPPRPRGGRRRRRRR
jgi:hypothetical protein